MGLVSPAGLRAQVRELWGPGMPGLGWRSGRGGRCQQGLQAAGATEGGERQQGPCWGPGDQGTWPATAPGCPRGCQWAQTSAGGSWLFHSVLVAFTQEGRGRGQAGGAAWSHVGGRPLPSAGPGPRGFISVPLCSHRRGSCRGRPAVCTWAGTAPLALRSRHRTHHPWSAAARQGAGAGHGPSTGHPSGCRCNEDWTAVLSPGTGLVAGPGLQQGLCPRRHAGAWVRGPARQLPGRASCSSPHSPLGSQRREVPGDTGCGMEGQSTDGGARVHAARHAAVSASRT